ncbi:NlpC/P60 family protein [Falsiruegeria mediterranea]|uniref:NlpC/P60 family protein n=1 Tax=Falsiruegeria mediterranea TaxID=1280832 RepID=UPI0015F26F41|nr:peptidoglycan-binding protein [Falsiruegeria mediterranea]
MTTLSYDVRWLQRALQTLGFEPGLIDGIKGPDTDRAVIAFKRSEGLRPRAYVGPITLARLRDAVSEPEPAKYGPETAPEPPWLVEIGQVMGLHEVRDNAELRAWLASDGSTLGDPARFPWCGDAAITALEMALPFEPLPPSIERNPYWARNFADYGVKCGRVYGAVASFTRGKGGHVGFAVGYDPKTHRYRIRGGNQSNMVRDSWLAGSRLLALRWPSTWPAAHQRPLPVMNSAGQVLSTNEA